MFYSPSKDMVQLPPFGASKEAPSYYATALHELGLLDGRKIRLDRDLSSPFGDHTYAAEELVAELKSAFLRSSESKANSCGVGSLLPRHAALQSQHVYFGDERDGLGRTRCESKQDPGRSLVLWQSALEDHWLVYDAAAPEVADCQDQRRATIAVAKLKLARIRQSAAVFSFGMCSEPAPIKADDFIEWARHHDRVLPLGKECGQPPCRPHQSGIGERRTLVLDNRSQGKDYKTISFAIILPKMLLECHAQGTTPVSSLVSCLGGRQKRGARGTLMPRLHGPHGGYRTRECGRAAKTFDPPDRRGGTNKRKVKKALLFR